MAGFYGKLLIRNREVCPQILLLRTSIDTHASHETENNHNRALILSHSHTHTHTNRQPPPLTKTPETTKAGNVKGRAQCAPNKTQTETNSRDGHR